MQSFPEVHRPPRFKVLVGVLLIVGAVIVQLKVGDLLGWKPDVVLATVITLSFLLNPFELMVTALAAVLLVTSGPTISIEAVILIAVPFGLLFARRVIFPFQGSLNLLLAIVLGVLVFYGVLEYSFIFSEYTVILRSIAVSGVFGLVLYRMLRYVYSS